MFNIIMIVFAIAAVAVVFHTIVANRTIIIKAGTWLELTKHPRGFYMSEYIRLSKDITQSDLTAKIVVAPHDYIDLDGKIRFNALAPNLGWYKPVSEEKAYNLEKAYQRYWKRQSELSKQVQAKALKTFLRG